MNIELIMENSLQVFSESGSLLIELIPYVFIGVIIGEVLKYTSWAPLVTKVCNTHPLLAISLAAVLGTISPLCTYGTIPIVIYLLKIGTPVPPILTFLSTSSLMNPQLFILTWGGINSEMALVRLVTVLIYGILLGLALMRVTSKLLINPKVNESSLYTKRESDCQLKEIDKLEFMNNTWRSIQFIGYYLIIGIILGSIIEVFVPGR
jgi:uncharacterized membrane protein YraQ (UPF0718 family)